MLAELFQYSFMVRALIVGLCIGVVAPVLGIFMVTRRYSLMADTLAHVSLAGVALGLWLGISPITAALAVSILAALGIEQLRQRGRFSGESVLALFLTGGLAVAVLFFSLSNNLNSGTLSYLFGSITTVSYGDTWLIGGLSVVTLVVLILLFRRLFLVSFDEELASAQGLRTGWLRAVLVVLSAVVVSLAMRVVGTLLIGAMMVIPVMAASALGRGFRATTILSVVFSLTAVGTGILLSFAFDVATGAAMVVMALVIFGLVMALRGRAAR